MEAAIEEVYMRNGAMSWGLERRSERVPRTIDEIENFMQPNSTARR